MKFCFCVFIFIVSAGICAAQTVQLSGRQFKRENQNAVLESDGVKITKTMLIDSVFCNCDGFWLMRGVKGDKPFKAFWTSKFIEKAYGFELKPDTYFVYPNIKEDSTSAFVALKLVRKK